jgi:para-aminobenzoate synthetase / 4-amino-4-deoxychorismate lyase
MNTNMKPLLSFEFAGSDGKIKPCTFKNPHKVLIAYTLDEVLKNLQLVEEAVDHGYYAAGFLSYESAAAFDPANKVKSGSKMPYLWFGIFSEPTLEALRGTGEYNVAKWQPSVTKDEYNQSIMRIKDYIKNGDTYQTNYTIRLHSQFAGDDAAFFEVLKKAQSSNYCAYIHTGEHSILSVSPELFFRLEGDKITTRPMKGTTNRGKSFAEDTAKASELYHSVKDRAENVMIVDLLRNDLGVVAEPGTVKVEKLFEIEQYPTVHQMTSTITAQLAKNTSLVDIFKALFPCGSITGAPKISTMKVISELETSPREVYCGAIGYITPNREAIFNVPIRTVLIDHQTGRATYGVGGGITWDSTSEGEYQEVLAKAKLLETERGEFQLLESFLLDNGAYFLLEEHLERLERSANYFQFPFNLLEITDTLDEFASVNITGKFKVRFLLATDGEITIEGQDISPEYSGLKVILAEESLDKNNLFLYHKTTNRKVYSSFQMKKPSGVFDILLWNEDGEITEFTNGNVVLEIDGGLWTPPVKSGLLAGTFREWLLKSGEIQERILTRSDLKKSTKIWFINSVRKWVEVKLV